MEASLVSVNRGTAEENMYVYIYVFIHADVYTHMEWFLGIKRTKLLSVGKWVQLEKNKHFKVILERQKMNDLFLFVTPRLYRET